MRHRIDHKIGSAGSRLTTRREALRWLSSGWLLSLGLWPEPADGAERPDGAFRFVVVNDTHYMSEECGVWLEGVVRGINRHGGVQFCLIAGDLTEHGRKNHLAAAREVFRGLDCPYYVVPGNHDYLSPTSRWAYDRVFPRRLNYWFRHRGWQFVGLDTTEGQKYEGTRIAGSTLSWMDEHLRFLNRRQPTVVFTHFPMGAAVKYRPVNTDALLDRLRPFPLRAVFCGHFHGFTERAVGGAAVTTNRCCALKRANHDRTKEKGYFLCTAAEGTVRREFIQVQA